MLKVRSMQTFIADTTCVATAAPPRCATDLLPVLVLSLAVSPLPTVASRFRFRNVRVPAAAATVGFSAWAAGSRAETEPEACTCSVGCAFSVFTAADTCTSHAQALWLLRTSVKFVRRVEVAHEECAVHGELQAVGGVLQGTLEKGKTTASTQQ